MRSDMLRIPIPRCAVDDSNPRPSSTMLNTNEPIRRWSVTVMEDAPAYFAAFCNASEQQ
jgi:hypothetical protein